jgi:hypothetical protein
VIDSLHTIHDILQPAWPINSCKLRIRARPLRIG